MNTALVLAAGKGTRMRSRLSKVLHPLCGRPMAGWVLQAVADADLQPAVVVGHQADAVRAALTRWDPLFALQADQRGTGHAVQCAAEAGLAAQGVVVVLPGDAPLIRAETLRALVAAHGDALCTVLTLTLDDPAAYGRIVRDADGTVQRIVEYANASEAERAIQEMNSGVYAFDAAWLVRDVLPHLTPHPPKDELYLTDAIEAAAAAGRLAAMKHDDPQELMGVNDRAALSVAEAVLRARINTHWMEAGVGMRDPAHTYVDADVTLAQDVTVGPGCLLTGHTTVAEGVTLEPHCVVIDSQIGPESTIKASSHLQGAHVGPGCAVGPFARLREGTVLAQDVKVGNFVETKKATLGAGAKASHLTYLGDASVGAGANIGAGTITCNYDGWGKHRTEIGERAFIGSNSALVAPVTVGAGAIVGAGSTVVQDVPAGALTVTRGRQKNLADKAATLHKRNARAAGKEFIE